MGNVLIIFCSSSLAILLEQQVTIQVFVDRCAQSIKGNKQVLACFDSKIHEIKELQSRRIDETAEQKKITAQEGALALFQRLNGKPKAFSTLTYHSPLETNCLVSTCIHI